MRLKYIPLKKNIRLFGLPGHIRIQTYIPVVCSIDEFSFKSNLFSIKNIKAVTYGFSVYLHTN